MFNLRIVKEYLRHRLKATTRHGLHSPFVYRLVDKVFYDFSDKKVYPQIETQQISANQHKRAKKLNRLLYRILNDKQPKNIILPGNVSPVTEAYIKAGAGDAAIKRGVENFPTVLDTVIIDTKNGEQASAYFHECLPHANEDSLIILKNIYCTDDMKILWRDIKANPQVTVTVDLFMVGLIYFRKGQRREDFLIRF